MFARLASGFVVLLALASPVGAQPAPDLHPLHFSGDVDAPVLAATGFAFLAGNLMQSTLIPKPPCDPCRAADINPLDRSLAGRRDPLADRISYGMVALLLAAPLVGDGLDVWHSHAGARSFGDDTGVYLEALAIDGALNEVVKLAVRRPRPFAYDPSLSAADRASADTYVSFYSEHSSLAFTAAAAYTTIFALRHRDRPALTALVGLLTMTLAGSTAALRVVAGAHFYSDVAIGALVGTAVGVTMPLLHRRHRLPALVLAPIDHGAMALLTLVQ